MISALIRKYIATVSEDFSDIYYRLEDICHELRALRDSVVFSPEELDAALSRRDLIDSLKKKYGNTIDEILEYQAKLAEDLAVSENFDETKNSLMRELRELKAILTDACKLLTQAREKKASELAQAIQKELHDLNFNDSSVKIAVEPLERAYGRRDGQGGNTDHHQ